MKGRFTVEPAFQKQQEKGLGSKLVRFSMAEGIVSQLASEIGVVSVLIESGEDDARKWKVETKIPEIDKVYTENFWDFPSNEIKATIMLLRGRLGP
jgi:hypothetical protein